MQLEQRGDAESCQAHGAAGDLARRRATVHKHAVAEGTEVPAPSSSVKQSEGSRGCVQLGRGMGRSGRWQRVEDGGRFMGRAWWTGRKRRRERRRRQRDCRRGWVRPMEKREENSRRGESERS